MSNDKKPEIVVALYHAEDWCGPCQSFAPIWDEFIKKVKSSKDYKYIKLDRSDGTCSKIDDKSMENISDKLYDKIKEYRVSGFPTILLFVDNNNPKEFSGNRQADTLFEFIESKGEKHSKGKSGGSNADNAFEEYQEDDDGNNFDQCGGSNKCEFKGGKKAKGDEYYKMKYYKYKAKYIELKEKYNAL